MTSPTRLSLPSTDSVSHNSSSVTEIRKRIFNVPPKFIKSNNLIWGVRSARLWLHPTKTVLIPFIPSNQRQLFVEIMYDYANSTETKQTSWRCTPVSSPGTGEVWFEEGSWGFGGGRGPFLSSCTGLPCAQQTGVTKETLKAWQKATVNRRQWIKLLRTLQRKKTQNNDPHLLSVLLFLLVYEGEGLPAVFLRLVLLL